MPKLFALRWFKENIGYDFNEISEYSKMPFLTRLCLYGKFNSFDEFKAIFLCAIELGASANPDTVKGISPLGIICASPNDKDFIQKFDFILQHTDRNGLNCFFENPLCNLLKQPLDPTTTLAVKKLLARSDVIVDRYGSGEEFDNTREFGTPMHYAVRNLDVTAIKLLLDRSPKDVVSPFSFDRRHNMTTVFGLITKLIEANKQNIAENPSPSLLETKQILEQIRELLQKKMQPADEN